MEKGWWGEYPPSDRQNRLPEPEQHGGACPGGRQPVPAGVLLCCAPAPEPFGDRQGSIREGAFCPMPCIRGLAQELLSLSPGVWTERRRSIPEIFQLAFAPYPGPRPPGYSHRERDSPARFSAGLLPHTPALARRGIFTGRGTALTSSVPGFCPYPGSRPPGHSHRERDSTARSSTGLLPIPRRSPARAFLSGEGQPCLTQLPVNQPL